MCLKELRDEFLYDCECRHLAKGSLRNYRASTRFLLEFLERKQITELEDVRPRHLRDLLKEKQDAGNTPRYINDLLKVWRTWFNYLVEEGYLEERDNPAKKVKPLRQPRTIIDTFTAAEMKRMIQFYDGNPIRWIDETKYGAFVNDEDVNLYYIVEAAVSRVSELMRLDEEIRALTKQASEKTYIGGLTKECVDAFVSMVYLYDDQTMKVEFNCEDVIRRALEKYGA